MELIETSVGLPNTCYLCGKWVNSDTWFAPHIDGARSGLGGHEKCMKKLFAPPQPKVAPEPEPEPEV